MTGNSTVATEAQIKLGPNDPRINIVAQALSDARSLQSRATDLEDTYIRYVLFANSGGILACLGIANSLAGKEHRALSLPLANVAGPIAIFFVGLIFCGLITSLRGKLALHDAEEAASHANSIMFDLGHGVTLPKGAFSPIEKRGIPYLNRAINILGIFAQLAFLVGGVWGIVSLAQLH